MEIGDIVINTNYPEDVYFYIDKITGPGVYSLKGINYRLSIGAKASELNNVPATVFSQFKKLFKDDIDRRIGSIFQRRKKELNSESYDILPGKILHIDADEDYLRMCSSFYKKLDITAAGEKIEESQQPVFIRYCLEKHRPDILVITGHDSLRNADAADDVNSYKSSEFFVETVKSARSVNPSKDSLLIIAGACQSYYEALIEAGANVASSPKRVLIHALDPLFAAERLALTPVDKYLNIDEILENSITGPDGMGGIQSKGTCRYIQKKVEKSAGL